LCRRCPRSARAFRRSNWTSVPAIVIVDLVREGVDCAVRVGEPGDSGMIGRRLATLEQITVASADYVRRAWPAAIACGDA
jgi:DNA-binding transcriptional LysR family regulator